MFFDGQELVEKHEKPKNMISYLFEELENSWFFRFYNAFHGQELHTNAKIKKANACLIFPMFETHAFCVFSWLL